jgi:hypothetical protein
MPERVRAAHPELRRTAYRFYREALRWGMIAPPERCEGCGEEGPVDGHHANYAAPKAVTFYCKKCHAHWHWGTLVHDESH